jgi:hypothetical protein
MPNEYPVELRREARRLTSWQLKVNASYLASAAFLASMSKGLLKNFDCLVTKIAEFDMNRT